MSKATSSAIKQSQSRTKRAISNTGMILLSVYSGAKIRFIRSKESKYAMKVFAGEEVTWDNGTKTSEDFYGISRKFEAEMNVLASNAKRSNTTHLYVNKKSLEEVYVAPVQQEEMTRKQKIRNKEAAFSNYLSRELITRGYTLITKIKGVKMTTKSMHCYSWLSAITPDGVSVDFYKILPKLKDVVQLIEKMLVNSVTCEITRNDLLSVVGALDGCNETLPPFPSDLQCLHSFESRISPKNSNDSSDDHMSSPIPSSRHTDTLPNSNDLPESATTHVSVKIPSAFYISTCPFEVVYY
ncbi:Uncharacterized protein QTN25_006366 [Entamoeba marina]